MSVRTNLWALVLFSSVPVLAAGQSVGPTTGVSAKAAMFALPVTFEVNQGQSNPRARFLTHGHGYTAFLTSDGLMVALASKTADRSASGKPGKGSNLPRTVSFRFIGAAKNPTPIGENPRLGQVNYFLGNDPRKWRTHIPTYGRVRYKNLYPGVDLVYYGSRKQLEYDLELSPGADPEQIEFEVQGASRLELDGNKNLIVHVGSERLTFASPMVYQVDRTGRQYLDGTYFVTDSTHVAFRVPQYNPAKGVVIDPRLIYSTYLGGSGSDTVKGIAVDNFGNLYVAGFTDSTDFPAATIGSLPTGSPHAFLAKLDPDGNLIYADYLGGNSQDFGYALAVDGSNAIYITGSTASSDFPVVNAYQPTYPGAFNAFLTKISSDGASLLYSTYLGGNGSDIPSGIGVDAAGEPVIAGYTSSNNFPVVNAFQPTMSANQGGIYGQYGFLSKFSADGVSLAYSTYLGGSANVADDCGGTPCWPQPINIITGMALDPAGDAYVSGITNAYDYPTIPGSYLMVNSTSQNSLVSFLTKFGTTGVPQYSTYFYESSGLLTEVTGVAVDSSGSAYVTGEAFSDSTFPLTTTAICDPAVDGVNCSYAFVSKFDSTGSTLSYSTFLGPNNYAIPSAIVVDSNNDAYVLAASNSTTYGTVSPIEAYSGGNDLLLAEIDPTGTRQIWATYFGGSLDETSAGLAIDSTGNLYVSGTTDSTDIPISPGASQDNYAGNTDSFVLKIATDSGSAVIWAPGSLDFTSLPLGATSVAQTVLLKNVGDSALSISSLAATGDFAVTHDCGTAVPALGSCNISATFTPTAAGQRNGEIVISDDAAGSPQRINLAGAGVETILIAPTTLNFGDVAVGTSSIPQSITVTNSDTASLQIASIQTSGDYSQTNNCGSGLPAGSSCTVNVLFTPTKTGSGSATLIITAANRTIPKIVSLTGAGVDFSLASNPTSVTVKSGSNATYQLAITSLGGDFGGTIQLTCGSLPKKATCKLFPGAVTANGNPGTSVLTITTGSTAVSSVAGRRTALSAAAIWLELPGLGLFGVLVTIPKSRMRKVRMLLLIASVACVMTLFGCAGGTGITRPPVVTGVAPGNYTITATGSSGAIQHTVSLTLIVQ